jgi:WD40 repeat protein
VWEVNTDREITNINLGFRNTVNSVAFSPDSKFVVSGSIDDIARVWDVSTGHEITSMDLGLNDTVNSVAFSPDGRFIISGSKDGTVRIWEANEGREIAHMSYEGMVLSVAFSPNGKYIVSGTSNGTIHVEEIKTGQEIARLVQGNSSILTVAFSLDGKQILSANVDNITSDRARSIARVWEYLPEDLIANACSRATRNLTRVEWQQYIGDALPYQAVCENLPIEPEVTATP